MIRKLIQLSPSTAVISLPAKWIQKNNLTKGTPISVDEVNNKLIVSAQQGKSHAEITIDVSQLQKKLMWGTIDAAYTAGYDTINIITKDQEQTAQMTKVVRYFPGMIIKEERPNKVVFTDIADYTQENIEQIQSRIFNLIITMIEDSIDAIQEKQWDILARMKYRDYNINSYIAYCFRQISKSGYIPRSGSLHSYIKVLEMCADKLAALFEGVGNNQIDADTKVFKEIVEMFRAVHRLHFNFSIEKVSNIEAQRSELLQSLPKMHVHVKLYTTEILELLFDLEELEMQLHT